MSSKLKSAFAIENQYGAFYTGGSIQWLEDTFYCQTETAVHTVDFNNGSNRKLIETDDDFIQTFVTNGENIISAHISGLLKLWSMEGKLEKMWKSIHKGPVVNLRINNNKLIASGGSDSIIRIWELQNQICLWKLNGMLLEFHPTENFIFAQINENDLVCYSIEHGNVQMRYQGGHFSKITALAFANDFEHFVTSGRDNVLILWKFNEATALKTIATFETIESFIILPKKFKMVNFKPDADGIYVATGSAGKGNVRVWDVKKSLQINIHSNGESDVQLPSNMGPIQHIIFNSKFKSLCITTIEHNIIIYHLKSLVCLKQFIGFSDEILDLAFVGKNDNHVAVATNSKDIKLYEYQSMNCQILSGHEDMVLALNVSPINPNLMASCGKDNSVRLWYFDDITKTMCCKCVAKRHAETVTTVAFSQLSTRFLVSAGDDACIKLWDIKCSPPEQQGIPTNLDCRLTINGHQKGINCITVSPNDRIIGSSSQDKTIKLWNENLELLGTLKGHKRGVWCLKFSSINQVLISSSADCTIKMWSVTDYTCLKTFQGHESSVLKVHFLSNASQILSCGTDGLIKLFNIKTSECVCTLDHHTGKIWGLDVKKDESGFISGGSDSLLIKWKDITEELKQEKQINMDAITLEEQEFSNYLKNNNFLKALKLALKLEKPFQALKIIEKFINNENNLIEVIEALRNDQKEYLLKCALDWNANSRNCHAAQLIINILLTEIQYGLFKPSELSRFVEDALPYTERHLNRLTALLQDAYIFSYTAKCIHPHQIEKI